MKTEEIVCAHCHFAQIKFHTSIYKVSFNLILLVIVRIMMNGPNRQSPSWLRNTRDKKNQEKDYRTNFLKSNITTANNRN